MTAVLMDMIVTAGGAIVFPTVIRHLLIPIVRQIIMAWRQLITLLHRRRGQCLAAGLNLPPRGSVLPVSTGCLTAVGGVWLMVIPMFPAGLLQVVLRLRVVIIITLLT